MKNKFCVFILLKDSTTLHKIPTLAQRFTELL